MTGETSEDRLLNGRLRLRQARAGYRAGMDAALLAAACDARPGDRVLEAGCGAGGALLAAAVRRPLARFTGIERDAIALDLARHNIAANGLAAHATVFAGDIQSPFATLNLAPFDQTMANPPFFDDPSRLRGPAPAKREAWLAEGGVEAWIAFLLKAARQGGAIFLIHRADRLGDILAALSPKAGGVQVRPIHPFTDAPAKRVIVRAVKSDKAPLRLLAPLILHERGGDKHTAHAEAILRGEADLPWS